MIAVAKRVRTAACVFCGVTKPVSELGHSRHTGDYFCSPPKACPTVAKALNLRSAA